MNKLQIFIFFGLTFFCSISLFAQDDLPSENVTVLNNFQAQLAESQRLEIEPPVPPVDTARRIQDYYIATRNLSVDYPPPKIRPLAMRGKKVDKGYNAFLKAGVGLPNAFMGQGSYNYTQKDKFNVGFNLLHHSANFKDTPNQRFMTNDLDGKAAYYFDQGFGLQANLGYSSNDSYFYAYNFIDSLMGRDIAQEDARQRIGIFEVGANLFNSERTVADFNYDVGFDLYRLADDYASTELGFDLELKGKKWINEVHSFDIVLITDFTNFNDTATQNLNNFFLQPSFTFHNDFLKVKLGGNLASHDDEFFIYPDIEASANILGTSLAAFVGAEGDLQKNTFRSLTDYNPFLKSRVNLGNTEYLHFYGGVKGDLKIVQYSVQAGYKDAKNLALFLADEVLESGFRKRFDVLYDTVSIFNIRGTAAVQLFDDLQIIGTVNQNIYSTTQQEKAWHLPALSVNGTVLYTTMEGDLQLKGELFFENGVPFINDAGDADNLNGLFDVSLSADYYFLENVGAFLQLNNLANNKRQRWEGYPTFGTNVLVGVSARF